MYDYKLYVRAPLSEVILEKMKANFSEVIYDPWNVTGERFYEDEMLANLLKIKPDIFITELDRITPKVLDGYAGLKVVGDCRSTPENINVAACTERKLPILCTPARNAQAVAEMVVGLIISYYRHLIPSTQWIKDGKWVDGTTPYFTWMGNELYAKKVGFVGFGAVGKATAKLMKAFNCEISYYDPFVDNVEGCAKKELDEIFKDCDIISLHLPVVESTKGLIDKKYFSMMKESALFINTARSAVVNEEDLLEVIEAKKIKGAILDVLSKEPANEEAFKFTKYDNVMLTPHICGASYEVINHQSEIIFDRLMKFLEGKDVESVVYNKDSVR